MVEDLVHAVVAEVAAFKDIEWDTFAATTKRKTTSLSLKKQLLQQVIELIMVCLVSLIY